MPLIDSSCSICSLRTWALIVLLLSAIMSIVYTFAYVEAVVDSASGDRYIRYPFTDYADPNPIATLVLFIGSVVCFTTAIFGINGIRKNAPKYLKPYLYFTGSSILLAIAILLYRWILKPKHSNTNNATFVLSMTIAIMLVPFLLVKSYEDSMLTSASAADGNV